MYPKLKLGLRKIQSHGIPVFFKKKNGNMYIYMMKNFIKNFITNENSHEDFCKQ